MINRIRKLYCYLLLSKIGWLFKRKQFSKVLASLEQYNRMDPNSIHYFVLKSAVHYYLKEYEEGIFVLEEGISRFKNHSGLLQNMALLQSKLGCYDKAAYYSWELIIMDKDNVALRNNYGYYLSKTGDYKQAIEQLNIAIDLDANYAFAYNNRGYCYMQLDKMEAAKEDILYSLGLDALNAYAYKNRALWHIKKGDLAKAHSDLIKANDLGFESKYGNEVNNLIKQYFKNE